MTGTPADVRPGFICRVRLGGGLAYTSRRANLNEAQQVASSLSGALGAGDLMLRFPSATHHTVIVPASAVRAVEVVAVDGAAR